MTENNFTERFSNRVTDYVKCRPGYPAAAIEVLQRECGLKKGTVVADLGSGTGILTRALLEAGATVHAVEPNEPMRSAADEALSGFAEYRSIGATAERTTLPDASVDVITAAQAFHWFDIEKTRNEARRILRGVPLQPNVALLWNERLTDGDPFLEEYEALIKRHATDYGIVDHRKVGPAQFDAFFGKRNWTETLVPNEQVLDCEGLAGRLLSSSYVPASGQPGHREMVGALRALFDRHERDGRVVIRYEVKIVTGIVG